MDKFNFDLQLFAEGEETNEANESMEVKPNITVKDNGNGNITAEVEPIDPMGDVEETDEKPADNNEADDKKPDDNAGLEKDIKGQIEVEADVKKDLADKGVDFDKLSAEYADNGSLSADSMEALKKAGYPESVVNAYLNGLEALNERFTTTVKGYAGGEEGFKQLADFISTQPKSVVDAYNDTIQTGNLGQIKLMIDGLKSNMTAKYGTNNPTIMGGGTSNVNASGYTSMEQMTKDMSDPRYQVDPAFTKTVMQKIKNATIF